MSENDTIKATLYNLMIEYEEKVRLAHHEAIVARQYYMDVRNSYYNLKTLFMQHDVPRNPK